MVPKLRLRMYGYTLNKPKFLRTYGQPFGIDKQDKYTLHSSLLMQNLHFDERKHHIVLRTLLLRLLFVFSLPISSPPGLRRVYEVQHSETVRHRISLQIRPE